MSATEAREALLHELSIVGDEHADLCGRAYIVIRELAALPDDGREGLAERAGPLREALEELVEAADDVACYPEGPVGFEELWPAIVKARAALAALPDDGREKPEPPSIDVLQAWGHLNRAPGAALPDDGREPCPYCNGAGCLPCRGRGTVGPAFRSNRALPDDGSEAGRDT